MDWGVHLPQLGQQAGRDALVEFATKVEEWGFHSGWVSDHIAWPSSIESSYPYTADGSFPAPNVIPWLDPIGTLTFVAACTDRLRLGTTVLILGYRPPVQTAKQLATLDVLSGGRLILGVGVGWMEEEFDVLQMPFDHRGGRGDEQIEVFAALFSEPQPAYDGRFYRFPPVGFEPKPVQQPVPIWVGGSSEPAFRRAARYGHAFHAAFEPVATIVRSWARVRQLAEEHGRDPADLQLSVRCYLDFDGIMDPEKSLGGSPDQIDDGVGRFLDAGVSHVLLDPVAPGGLQGRLTALERFASHIA
jgi:probable F420-dependent oxidoreductase